MEAPYSDPLLTSSLLRNCRKTIYRMKGTYIEIHEIKIANMELVSDEMSIEF